MLPIGSPLEVSYMTFIVSNVAYRMAFEVFNVKAL